MIGRRAIRSPLLWMALALALTVAAPGHSARTAKPATRWAATPSVPCPLSIEAGQAERMVRVSFDTYAPVLRSSPFSQNWQRAVLRDGRQEPARIRLFEFGPLHRRPPPSFS